MESAKGRLFIQIELLWFLLSFLLGLALAAPIYLNAASFPFYPLLFTYVVLFVTFTRYIFLLKFTFLAKRQAWKVLFVFAMFPILFFLGQELNYFQTFIDENGPEAVVGELALNKLNSLMQYSRNVILLFGVGSMISGFILPFRLFFSVWRVHNGYQD
ncbi:MAG: hypothetical protein NWS63_10260 [Saprospiraceae bacterium]|jgi:hypothetical protein|nr:hypothetical protein [Saprospiraceae bacterium]MDP5000154.1 hypothetical protein [Saprospiraceae bacterium]